ncbi:MAG: ornithine cyclodeaminase family protein [Acidimicrobiia bacterium]|nr:ornithine cyclodeaminase family protein [Acidimicrobiia bacterium]
MLFLDADTVIGATPWTTLMGALADALRAGTTRSPDRHVHDVAQSDGSTGALLLMPSWVDNEAVGVKVVTYFPANAATEHPTVNAAYLLFDGATGLLTATIDGDALTARRTAAVSSLAAHHLARPDAKRLLIVGTGQLAPNLALAHSAERDLDHVAVWGRSPAAATSTARLVTDQGLPAVAVDDLGAAAANADIISCATGATTPLIHGSWLRPGTHVDLVGGFRPDMREADDEAVRRSTVFADTVAGASVSGDLAQPLASGLLQPDDIAADLAELVSGDHPGRRSDDEITLFKSAGFAAADLAAARLVARVAGGG